MQTLNANVENKKLSDTEFRKFVKNSIPIVIFSRTTAMPSDIHTDQPEPKTKSGIILAVRQAALDLHRNRYMAVLGIFSLESFSVARLSEVSESRLQELLAEIKR